MEVFSKVAARPGADHAWEIRADLRIHEHFERDNRELHRRYFEHFDFDAIFGPPPQVREEQRMAQEIEALEEVAAIPMDLLLKLMKSSEAQGQAPPVGTDADAG